MAKLSEVKGALEEKVKSQKEKHKECSKKQRDELLSFCRVVELLSLLHPALIQFVMYTQNSKSREPFKRIW